MTQHRSAEVTFDEWRDLARTDPEAFEARRRAAVAEAIALAPADRRQRLERLQWRIDRERERYRDPLAACARLSCMMWESVHGPGGLVEHIRHLDARWSGRSTRDLPTARLLPFPGRQRTARRDGSRS